MIPTLAFALTSVFLLDASLNLPDTMNRGESLTVIIAAVSSALSGLIVLISQIKGKREQAGAKIAAAARQQELDAKLRIIQAETAAAKERAQYAALAAVSAKDELKESRQERKQQIEASTAAIKAAVEENTDISRQAFAEANGHNAKIAQVVAIQEHLIKKNPIDS